MDLIDRQGSRAHRRVADAPSPTRLNRLPGSYTDYSGVSRHREEGIAKRLLLVDLSFCTNDLRIVHIQRNVILSGV